MKLFEAIRSGKFVGYTSRYVTDELEKAPEPKRSAMLDLIEQYGLTLLEHGDDALSLAKKYIAEGIIPSSYLYDSIHIAIASIHGLDVIVSYNFHHINREKTKKLTSLVNSEEGYTPIEICTAEEVLKHEGSDRA